jgi:hypothetical protein
MIVNDVYLAGLRRNRCHTPSLETARVCIENAGGEVILLSWLKFINVNYQHYLVKKKFNPFNQKAFLISDSRNIKEIPYNTLKIDNVTHLEVSELYKQYCNLMKN